jgi:hypothetical protein
VEHLLGAKSICVQVTPLPRILLKGYIGYLSVGQTCSER